MSNMKVLTAAVLAGLPLTAGAHGIRFHIGYGFWHDLMHLAPYAGGALIGAYVIFAFIRWQDTGTD